MVTASTTHNNVTRLTSVFEKMITPVSASRLAKDFARGEIGNSHADFEDWLNQQFVSQLVWLTKTDYSVACTHALFESINTKPIHRARDFQQDWIDLTRDFLGKLAFKRFMEEKLKAEIELRTLTNDLAENGVVSNDINAIKKSSGNRPPKVGIKIITGKFSTRWSSKQIATIKDVDTFVFVRVGILKEHYVGFLKSANFFKADLFPLAEKLHELNQETSQQLLKTIPEFEPIPAFISGYLTKRNLSTLSDFGSKNFELLDGKENWQIFVSSL